MNRVSERAMAHRVSPSKGPLPERVEIASEERTINLFLVLYGLLKKRWKLALALVLTGGMLGAMAALAAPSGEYHSVGMIRIRPNVPKILYTTEQTGVMPMFQSFVDSQLTLIQSEQVVEMAMATPDWQKLFPAKTPEAIAAFTGAIDVRRPKNSELIEVDFGHSDPDAAMIAMHAILDSYRTLYGDPNGESGAQTLKILEERQAALTKEYNTINAQIMQIAEGYGTGELEQLFQLQAQEVTNLQASLRKIEMNLSSMEVALEQSPETAPDDLTPEMIATTDTLMRDAVRQKLELELSIKQKQLNLGGKHPQVIASMKLLDDLNAQIERYAEIYRKTPGLVDDRLVTRKGIESQRARERNVRKFYEKARDELADLGQKNLDIQALRTKLQGVSKKLEETSQRIEQLDVESAASGRIEIVNKGNRPVSRAGDKRMVWGGAGGVAGMMFGIGIVALIGFLDRRVQNIKDTRDSFGMNHRLLGAVPVLEADGASHEQSQSAALAVHRIRAMLQLRASLDRRVFTLTSAVAGNGKTSLCSALGLSLAGSNSKTLLIDCDLIGGALSIRTNAIVRRKIGQICVRSGLINEEQLENALNTAKHQGCRLGEALVQLNYISEPDLVQMLTLQTQSAVGLFNVLDGEPLLDCVAATTTPGLSILPLGTSGSRYAAQLSPSAIRNLLRTARQHFDIVLIDTGPILGSLDASIVAAEADEAMLVLSRGDDRFLVQKALDELDALGAKVLGMIFNRAQEDDVEASGMSIAASVSRPRLTSKGEVFDGSGVPRLGPIATALDVSMADDDEAAAQLSLDQG